MARHSLFPAFMRFTYTSNSHVHHQVLPLKADPFTWDTDPQIQLRDASHIPWTDGADDWAAILAAILCGEASVDLAELSNFEAEPGPAEFLAAYELGVAGTHAGSPVEFAQAVFPFKGVGGTQLRVTILEGSEPTEIHVPSSGLGGGDAALVAFVLGDSDFLV